MRSRCRHHIVNSLERTQQSSLLHLTPASLSQSRAQRCHASTKTIETKNAPQSLAVRSESRHNAIGVQQVSKHIHSQLFPPNSTSEVLLPTPELVQLSTEHLTKHDLFGKTSDDAAPIAFDLPDLQGASLDEHFYRLGMDSAEPYLTLAKKYARSSPPARPRKWAQRSGWTKYYADGSWEAVDVPEEDVLSFDTEVMWRETSFPVMACALSATHWYSWLSPWLLKESDNDKQLIPLGDPSKPRMIVGHNIGYDRARILEEYDVRQSRSYFMDTMSLHVAVNGMCSRQRPTWVKHRKAREMQDEIAAREDSAEVSNILDSPAIMDMEEELWVGRSSTNSLRDVAKFHCGIVIDKTRREDFGELDRDGILAKLEELLDYCAADVDVTHKVYKKVFPNFLEVCPHPVSFAALRHLSSEILPIDSSWDAYINNAEATYHSLSSKVEQRLVDLAEKAVVLRNDPSAWQDDPWLSQLDWSGQEIRMVKGKKKDDPPRPAARQKLPGMPNWYKDLFPKADADIALTVRTRIAPLLLRMSWDNHPLVWIDKHGWTFKVPHDKAWQYENKSMTKCDMHDEEGGHLKNDHDHTYFKLPHKDGAAARCASPMAKGYLQFFEKGVLSSQYEYADEALQMNASCSYWISSRDRIMSQMAVYERDLDKPWKTKRKKEKKSDELGFILPQVIPMGTITRRAVENTWLTASNAKANRVGSELKSMIRAPPEYCFVGADVDSQELWIASLVGDASFKLHGGNAIGFMTLEGTKAAGTDLHSRTAAILGISRNDAKVFNYGRIYGAGLTFAQSLLRQFNPTMSEGDASRIAGELYLRTKGQKRRTKLLRDRSFWVGGTESLVFNRLEDFAEQDRPRTPVLGAGITEALMQRYVSKGGFMTSRINWAIQSSGVDYLHLLIISMDYLCRRFNIDARLALTVHDEIRYLAKEKDKYRTAMALQVANVWTRALFSQQMGIEDLPQSCAYFSAVDIDHVLRKEVDMDCITPSHPDAIPPGESVDILQLLAKGNEAFLNPRTRAKDKPTPQRFNFVPQTPVLQTMSSSNSVAYLRAQIATDRKEFDSIIKTLKSTSSKTSSASLKDKPERKRRGSQKQDDDNNNINPNVTANTQHRMQRYDATPSLMPVDWEKENSFGKYFADYQSKGNAAVTASLFKRLPNRSTYARP